MGNISRRDFLKGAVAGAAGVASMGLLGACQAATESTVAETAATAALADNKNETEAASGNGSAGAGSASFCYADSIRWDAQYDVVVVGFGGAGAVASITAAEAGANVLLVEKTVKGLEGGNTRVSCNFMAGVVDPEKYVEKVMKANNYLYTDTVDEETLMAAARAMASNKEWLEAHGGIVEAENPNEETGGCFFMLEDHDKDGNVLGYGNPFGDEKRYWNLVHMRTLENENIHIWYASPAQHLIQDPFTKTILGVQVSRSGETLNVRALNGVILTLGGFEYNRELAQNFFNRPYIYPLGSSANTGDGIYMCQEIGAQLWHMSNISGPDVTIYNPDLDCAVFTTKQADAFGVKRDQRANPLPAYNMILVGPDGSRFMSESAVGSHGRVNVAGERMLLQFPTPMYVIFDEETRMAGKFTNTWESEDNSEMLPWATIADTIEELAEKMGMENLVSQVETYNEYARTGNDVKYGRDPAQMAEIKTGPFYALKCVPAVYNTQGGARRNGNAEILDPYGNVIPHLYSAGEFGAIWPAYYGGGMNIAETCAFGQIAGRNAAAPKTEDLTYTFTPVESNVDNEKYADESAEPEYECGENEYIGRAWGVGGNEIVVRVKYVNGVIENVEVLSSYETPMVGCSYAVNHIPQAIVEANSCEIDSVTGATVSGNAIKEAVRNAIAQAG